MVGQGGGAGSQGTVAVGIEDPIEVTHPPVEGAEWGHREEQSKWVDNRLTYHTAFPTIHTACRQLQTTRNSGYH